MVEQKILMIGDTREYLFMALANKMEEASYTIVRANPDVEEIDRHIDDCWIIILYLEDVMMSDKNILTYLRDCMLDIDTPLFVVGEKKEINVVREVIPESAISGIFYRPINTLEMVEFFDDFIKNYRPREKKRILAVDDNGSMLRNLKSWLSERYTVDVATSGSMAIRSMVMRKPDLVLLDYEMPVADGPTVLEMIKADPEFRDIPTMFLTAKGDKDSVIRGLALKPEGYLLKSLTPQKIVESIDDFFHEQRINEKRRQLEASSMK